MRQWHRQSSNQVLNQILKQLILEWTCACPTQSIVYTVFTSLLITVGHFLENTKESSRHSTCPSHRNNARLKFPQFKLKSGLLPTQSISEFPRLGFPLNNFSQVYFSLFFFSPYNFHRVVSQTSAAGRDAWPACISRLQVHEVKNTRSGSGRGGGGLGWGVS